MIYLDNAATSYPKPQEVITAVLGVLKNVCGNPGRGGHFGSVMGSNILLSARESVKNILGVERASEIIFTLNGTDALNMAIKGTLREGDEVLVSPFEHNAVMRPLCRYERDGQITIKTLKPNENGVLTKESIDESVSPKTALVIVSHASNVSGIVQDAALLSSACHQYGIPFLLDAAQTIGHMNIQNTGADMIAFPCHKGLLSPMGTGALYVGNMRPRPFREGGTGTNSDMLLQPFMLPERYESGTINLPSIAGVLKGTQYVKKHQTEIEEKEKYWIDMLKSEFLNMPKVSIVGAPNVHRAGLLSFNVSGYESGEIADILNKDKICVRAGLHCAPMAHAFYMTEGAVRVSVGAFNEKHEIEVLLSKINTLCKNRG